mmetsp:Transcript_5502/g.15926  ORF Transcript_5502/g.15926 Transcript_5502/m.15926 type:complete len:215 (+) Transcript_5502:1935-2579(+)
MAMHWCFRSGACVRSTCRLWQLAVASSTESGLLLLLVLTLSGKALLSLYKIRTWSFPLLFSSRGTPVSYVSANSIRSTNSIPEANDPVWSLGKASARKASVLQSDVWWSSLVFVLVSVGLDVGLDVFFLASFSRRHAASFSSVSLSFCSTCVWRNSSSRCFSSAAAATASALAILSAAAAAAAFAVPACAADAEISVAAFVVAAPECHPTLIPA